jgi:ribulose-5-phosphate 4-epimerase/fuculose-1-phosphate aldolase
VTEGELREEICRVGRSLFERGYAHATAGNISVRLPEEQGGGYLITPTDACLGFLEPMRLARLDSHGQQISGDRGSKTIALHRMIYQASGTTAAPAACVIHTHSTHCVALTLANRADVGLHRDGRWAELLPALTPYFVMKVGRVPLIPYYRPGSPDAAQEVSSAITSYSNQGRPIRAVMLDRLGPNVWHKTPASAMATLEELEETAKLAFNAQCTPPALDEKCIQELRETFGAVW